MWKNLFAGRPSSSSKPYQGEYRKLVNFECSWNWSYLKTWNLYLIFVTTRDVNTAIMELLIMAYALKTSCAKNIIGVIPYFPYSKQCKMRKRGSIVCKLLASMLAKAGKYNKNKSKKCFSLQSLSN